MSQGMMSQVLNGDKNFSMEAANEIAAFMALSEEESEYFLLLVNYERAGTPSLRERLNKKILQEQKKANEIGKKLKPDQEFSEMAKTLVFSHWIYTGIWNMTACANFSDVDSIAAHLKLSRIHVQKAVDFLLKTGLCVKKNGRLSVGPQVLHIGNETSLVGKHHQNWRLHGITKMFEQNESDVFFTCPLSLSREAAELIRWKIPTFIEEIRNIVGPSPSEVVRCVNIDWFAF
jgi:uncharacterized protein (TIGR02147 family)